MMTGDHMPVMEMLRRSVLDDEQEEQSLVKMLIVQTKDLTERSYHTYGVCASEEGLGLIIVS